MTNEEKIHLIGQKVLLLSNNLDKYKSELQLLQQQLDTLKQQSSAIPVPVYKETKPVEVVDTKVVISQLPPVEEPLLKTAPPIQEPKATNSNFEEFIGGRLITIIGIVILVIGLGIGVKYAIDKDMLGPLARIVLAYVAGGILLGFALKLKEKYKAFSAVLLSGGMASLYFTTFVAYSIYHMFPQTAAFGIMVVFTAFTVFAATVYELEIIGIIGLVGAYAVPLLLSDGSGKIAAMFTYMAIINTGILILSFKKLWRTLNYFAFGFTWIIVTIWYLGKYDYELHFVMLMSFSLLFFIIFYISTIAYKALKYEPLTAGDVVTVLINSFAFFGVGYASMNNSYFRDYTGLFSLINALIHLVFAFIVLNRNKQSENRILDRKIFYLLMAMVLTFFTIAIPVQLNGNWVTLLWATEAIVLFTVAKSKNIRFYEGLAYIMSLIAIVSLVQDWMYTYPHYLLPVERTAFFNMDLFTSLFVAGSLGGMYYLQNKNTRDNELQEKKTAFSALMEYLVPVALLMISYMAFSNEISAFFDVQESKSVMNVPAVSAWAEPNATEQISDGSWIKLKHVCLHLYNLLFVSALSLFAIRKWNNKLLFWTTFSLNMLVIVFFIFSGLHQLRSLRNIYLDAPYLLYFSYSEMLIYIRYIAFALFGLLLYLVHAMLKKDSTNSSISKIYSGGMIHVFVLILLSVELIHLNILQHYDGAESVYIGTSAVYRIGLTSLWGIYAFVLFAYGIIRRKQVVRITAISIVGLAVLKLLLADTMGMSTGYKVIAYILLGVILLVVAFLYQKFKKVLFSDEEDEKQEQSV